MVVNKNTKFGGNAPVIGPRTTPEEYISFDFELSRMPEGSMIRINPLVDESMWEGPNSPLNIKHLKNIATTVAKYKLKPFVLLMPCPHPSSKWYKNFEWGDQWLPKETTWSGISNKVYEFVVAMEQEFANVGITDAIYQIHNEPVVGKPGGSYKYRWAIWPDQMHRFWFSFVPKLATILPPEKLATPAISCFYEGRDALSKEIQSCFGPEKFDVLKYCGYGCFHLRLQAQWAEAPTIEQTLANFKTIFVDEETSEGGWVWQLQRTPVGRNKQLGIIIDELYLSPYDAGMQKYTPLDLFEFQKFVIERMTNWPLKIKAIMPWGIQDIIKDAPDSGPASTFGGWGQTYKKLGMSSADLFVGLSSEKSE